ncbi:PREDICTED: 4F2 cell-surface antigen heavy chain [Gekko japonicus]|uniref:4F2 cell-surface antigen heavy chain n=1 Tax=Gekko japonicus TaxID=146911 RepID=A0ABM1KF46_GEKJA|nr:PREDICTED: 4F2 cell-surface antigen heavy chain [Gekko japonicus]
MSSRGVTQDTELDLKDVELSDLDTEKQPMNASPPLAGSPGSLGEKNGVVKVKVAEEEEEGELAAKFTGLSKEELLQVAGTPAWVRTRWLLLILFWLGWLGMLAGAIVIIVQAPRCKDLPQQRWWQKGGIYRIQPTERFQDSNEDGEGDLAGLKQRMDYLNSLKVKGVVIGPLHVNSKDDLAGTNLQAIDQKFGTAAEFQEVLQAAKKKGLKVILDLTPNYKSPSPWFSPEILTSSDFQDKMKAAIDFWLKEGVSGIQIRSVEHVLNETQLLTEWKNLTEKYTVDDHSRVLIAATYKRDPQSIFSLLNETEAVDLLTSQYLLGLGEDGQGDTSARMIDRYIQAAGEKWPSWSVGRAGLVGEQLLRLYHMLVYTLPGTPFTDFGDEIGLRDLPGQPAESTVVRMRWDNTINFGFSKDPQLSGVEQQQSAAESNVTVQSQSGDESSILKLFRDLSELRGKERSLLHGDFWPAGSSAPSVFAYLRVWDQNRRYLVVLNFDPKPTTVSLTHHLLPSEATAELSTLPHRELKQQLSLAELSLHPSEGLLLSFPYVA